MMKNSDYSRKINEIYVKLLSEGKTDDVIRAINDQEYFEKIMVEHGLIDDSKWIASFWDRLVGVSKTGNISEFESLQREKRNKIPPKLFRFRPILGNSIRYKDNPLFNYFANYPFLNNSFSEEQLCKRLNENYIEIINLLPNISEIERRKSEVKGELYCANAFYQNDPYDSSAAGMKPSDIDAEMQRISKSVFSKELYDHVHNPAFSASFLDIDEPKSLPMWNLYAENYNGCCLEYDTEDWEDKWRDALFPVNYSENLLGLKDYLSTDGLGLRYDDDQFAYIIPFLTLKLRDWDYEREWRIVLNAELLKKHEKFNFLQDKRSTMPDSLVKGIIKTYLDNNQIYNEKINNNSYGAFMRLSGCLVSGFKKPSRIYFPDIEHNRTHSSLEKGDLIYIAAQRKMIEAICELNRMDFKDKPIRLSKMRFTINGIEFDDI